MGETGLRQRSKPNQSSLLGKENNSNGCYASVNETNAHITVHYPSHTYHEENNTFGGFISLSKQGSSRILSKSNSRESGLLLRTKVCQ